MIFYGQWRGEFAKLLDARFYTIEWLDQGVAGGVAVPFGNERACIVVEMKQYPAGAKEVHGLCAAGDMAAILELIERAEAWGRENDAVVATISSREGWGRVLHHKGYRPHQTTIMKDLTNGA